MDGSQERGWTEGGRLLGVWAYRPCPARARSDDRIASWSLGLDPDPGAPGLARRALAPLGAHLAREPMENVRLLTTELVTNAVVHADGRSVTLAAHLFPDVAIVSVSDEGAGFEPDALTGSRPGVPGGRGLELVALLADGLGIDSRSPFRVWFAIAR